MRVANFLLQIFALLFFLLNFLSNSVILGQLKTKIISDLTNFRVIFILSKEIVFLSPQIKTLAGGKFLHITIIFLLVPAC